MDAFSYGSNVASLVLEEVFLALLTLLKILDVASVNCHAFGMVGMHRDLLLLELLVGVVDNLDFLFELVFKLAVLFVKFYCEVLNLICLFNHFCQI